MVNSAQLACHKFLIEAYRVLRHRCSTKSTSKIFYLAHLAFDLVLAARDASKLEPSAQKIHNQTGQHVETIALDATDFSAVQQVSERFGPAASILHYNAAAIQKTDVFETPVETTQRNLSVDILGALAAIKYFAPLHRLRQSA